MIYTGPDLRLALPTRQEHAMPVPRLPRSGKPAIKKSQRAASRATRLDRQVARADAPVDHVGEVGWCGTPEHPAREHSWGPSCTAFLNTADTYAALQRDGFGVE